MLTKEFNELPLEKRSKLVFGEGKLIGVIQDHALQKAFYYRLNDLKVDVVYDKVRDRLLGINAWENASDRGALKTVII
ncbi:MAG: hypothetical protein ACLQQ4_14375 [Bacteroidia bacterium]